MTAPEGPTTMFTAELELPAPLVDDPPTPEAAEAAEEAAADDA